MLANSVETTNDITIDHLIDRMQAVLPKYHLLLKSVLASIQGDDRLTLPQLRSLRSIAASDGGMLTSILARQLRSAPPTVTRIVDGLVERGLVQRHPDPEDRRRWRLVITTPGEDLLAAYESALHTTLAERLDTIPEGRRNALWDALGDLDLILSDTTDDSAEAPAIG
ncbi:MAG: MarR family transcriptional regulator [Thermomicrobiales bacterium]